MEEMIAELSGKKPKHARSKRSVIEPVIETEPEPKLPEFLEV
jgi:hypothetical protein